MPFLIILSPFYVIKLNMDFFLNKLCLLGLSLNLSFGLNVTFEVRYEEKANAFRIISTCMLTHFFCLKFTDDSEFKIIESRLDCTVFCKLFGMVPGNVKIELY